MNNYILANLLNNPTALIILVVGLIALSVLIAFAIIKGPKIVAKLKAEKAEKEKLKAETEEKRAKDVEYDKQLLSEKTSKGVKQTNTNDSQKVFASMKPQHNTLTTKEEVKNKKIEEHEIKRTQDVISVLQGGVASSSANPKKDYLADKKENEAKAQEINQSKKESADVVSILQGKQFGEPKPIKKTGGK